MSKRRLFLKKIRCSDYFWDSSDHSPKKFCSQNIEEYDADKEEFTSEGENDSTDHESTECSSSDDEEMFSSPEQLQPGGHSIDEEEEVRSCSTDSDSSVESEESETSDRDDQILSAHHSTVLNSRTNERSSDHYCDKDNNTRREQIYTSTYNVNNLYSGDTEHPNEDGNYHNEEGNNPIDDHNEEPNPEIHCSSSNSENTDNTGISSSDDSNLGGSDPFEQEDAGNESSDSYSDFMSDGSDDDPPIYDGSSVSVKTFNSMFSVLANKHSMSSQATDSVLKLIKLILPGGNKCISSSYKLDKSLNNLGYSYVKHTTCYVCQTPLADAICTNNSCRINGQNGMGDKSSIFYVIELSQELNTLISENWDEMQTFASNFEHQPDVYKDILDGNLYQTQVQLARDNGAFATTLYWHTDGAPALKSKNMSLWPIQSFVVELPTKLRYSFKNILLSGLWYGKVKPNMQIFQSAFVDEVRYLMNGFYVPDIPNQKFQVLINGQIADLMAKGPSLNFKVHNGKFGCSNCLHPGKRLPGPGNKRVYEYKFNAYQRRNHEDSVLHARLAEGCGDAVFGIKGSSPVHDILHIPDMIPFDYMHQVIEGEYTRRLSKWLNNECPSGVSLKAEVSHLTSVVKNISLPHDFNRKHRPFEEFKKWKASEKQTFFLHTGLPVLKTVLPSEYFYHHALFVTGIWLLSKDCVSRADIAIGEAMLENYTRLLIPLFNITEATFNSHSLTHLGEQVRNHGPLILHSGFVFESMLAHLKRQFHGTRGVSEQIIKRLAVSQHLAKFAKETVQNQEDAKSFVEHLLKSGHSTSLILLNHDVFFYPPLKPELPHLENDIDGFPINSINLHFAQRMLFKGQVFHSFSYVNKRNSTSFMISFKEEITEHINFGKVEYYLKDGGDGFAVVNIFENLQFNLCQRGLPEPDDCVVKHFLTAGHLGSQFTAVRKTENYKCIKCLQIISRIVFVPTDDEYADGFVSSVFKSYQHD